MRVSQHAYKEVIDHLRYIHNLSSNCCKIKAWKSSGLNGIQSLLSAQYWCSALPAELSNQLEAGHIVSS